jgi:predicted O-methyltransferase YrrM
MFDISDFMCQEDPWLKSDEALLIPRIYREKHALALLLQPRTILEIGVRCGYSAAAFLTAATEAQYVGYDADTTRFGGFDGALVFAKRMLASRFPSRTRIITQDTQKLDKLPFQYADLVHVDGDHSYEGCWHDLTMAAPIAHWILVDDITFQPAVGQATRDFIGRFGYAALELPTVRGDMLIEMHASRAREE